MRATIETGIHYRDAVAGIVQHLIPMRLVNGAVGKEPKWTDRDNGILTPYAVGFCEFLARSEEVEDQRG